MSRAPQRHDYPDDWCVGSSRLILIQRRPEELNVSARRTLGWRFCAD